MSNKSEHIQVEWLISQISELDGMIAMHRSGDNDFMADQYAGRRLQYFKELISLLSTSKFNATGLETFPLINALIKENYTKSRQIKTNPVRQNAFDRTLEFYRKRSTTGVVKRSIPLAEQDELPAGAKKVKSTTP